MRRLVALLALALGLGLGAQSAEAVPSIVYGCSPAPVDCSGWYRSPVSLDWTVVGTPTPGTCVDRVLTTDTSRSHESCIATEGASSLTAELVIKLDATPPGVTGATPDRPPDANGWYRAPVAVAFAGTDVTSGIHSCAAPTYAGPDSAAGRTEGTCTDVAGNVSSPLGFELRYDATGPDVTAGRPERKPDHGRWYNRPVAWRFSGRDALSGLAECPPVRYAGPEGPQARVIGACADKAGNVAARGFTLRYDASPPAVPVVAAVPRDHAVKLRIASAPDVRRIAVVRAPGRRGTRDSTIYRGRPRNVTDTHASNGRRYLYTVVASDRAANRSRRTIAAVPGPRLLGPADGATLTGPPRLRWTPVRHASYYNVQLRRDGRKVLSRWPSGATLQLRERWRFEGRIRRLRPGSYHWDVWPGFGSRAAADYGERIGGRGFVVAAPATPGRR